MNTAFLSRNSSKYLKSFLIIGLTVTFAKAQIRNYYKKFDYNNLIIYNHVPAEVKRYLITKDHRYLLFNKLNTDQFKRDNYSH